MFSKTESPEGPARGGHGFDATVWMLLWLLAFSAWGQETRREDQRVPNLTVSGQAEVAAKPDLALVSLGVESHAATAEAAQNAVNSSMEEVLKQIKSVGVSERDIQTSGLNLTPVHSQPKPGEELEPPRILAYRASNAVQVRVHDLKRTGPVVDAGLKGGANQLQGITLALENETETRAAALKGAANHATAKARALADALGLKLGPIRKVEESSATVLPRRLSVATAHMAAVGTPVEPGEIQVEASLTIEFEIEPQTAAAPGK